jgi:sterol desaturase/sphingolipid hydroxylase (fatty acid hydroxylase superfamily)
VKPIPQLNYLGPLILASATAAFLWWQTRHPLRRQRFAAFPRLVRNLLFSTPGFALVRLSFVPAPLAVAWWADTHGVGLLHWLRAPALVAAVAGFLLMDWGYYWWHVATHRVAFLWRFHNVHHTDLDLDVSTAVRFHFGEVLLSVPLRVGLVALIGLRPATLVIYELGFLSPFERAAAVAI